MRIRKKYRLYFENVGSFPRQLAAIRRGRAVLNNVINKLGGETGGKETTGET